VYKDELSLRLGKNNLWEVKVSKLHFFDAFGHLSIGSISNYNKQKEIPKTEEWNPWRQGV